MTAPSHSSSYVRFSSSMTGLKAVEPVTVRAPRAQSIGGGESSRTTMMAASVTTQAVRATVMILDARPNSGGFSSGRAAVFRATTPSRMPPVTLIGPPTWEPVSRTRSLKCSLRLSGTRGSRMTEPSCRRPAAGVK